MLSPEHGFYLPDEPTSASVNELVSNLRDDHVRRSVSPENEAHRARVIRQQTILLEQNGSFDAPEDAKRLRKEARPEDHREEGGQG
jgi:hypothetical protein